MLAMLAWVALVAEVFIAWEEVEKFPFLQVYSPSLEVVLGMELVLEQGLDKVLDLALAKDSVVVLDFLCAHQGGSNKLQLIRAS